MNLVTRGLFAVWKPCSLGSNKVTLQLRKILQGGNLYLNGFGERGRLKLDDGDIATNKNRMWIKVGHGGTLDRLAEGVLVIGVGRDCKILDDYLLRKDKGYVFTGELGRMTDTLDRSGVLIKELPWEHITQDDLEKALEQFRGNILQAPPIFSALKVNGKRMSDLAIQARNENSPVLQPKPRPVTMKSLQLLKFEPPLYTLSVVCSSGTYMRSLARDIGHSLNTVSYMTALARTSQGSFTRETALKDEDWTIENIKNAMKESGRFNKFVFYEQNS